MVLVGVVQEVDPALAQPRVCTHHVLDDVVVVGIEVKR